MKHPIATPTGTVIDLAPFCGQNDVRSYLNAPFSVQGGTCACDGHALVWVDTNIQAPALSAAADGGDIEFTPGEHSRGSIGETA